VPGYIDIGANLTHDSFAPDLEQVLDRAHDVGIKKIVVTGASEEGSVAAHQLAQQQRGFLYATAGVHPHHASDYSAETDSVLRDLLRSDEVVAVGETGLDTFRNFSPIADQQKAFEKQLEIAAEIKKPLFMHQRESHERFMAILSDYLPSLGKGVVHCFTDSKEALNDYLDAGLYIGITGWICDERRGLLLRELVRHIPLDRMMIETDAPYLLPRDLKPKPKSRRNEPYQLAHISQVIAGCIGVDEEPFRAAVHETTNDFFAWPC